MKRGWWLSFVLLACSSTPTTTVEPAPFPDAAIPRVFDAAVVGPPADAAAPDAAPAAQGMSDAELEAYVSCYPSGCAVKQPLSDEAVAALTARRAALGERVFTVSDPANLPSLAKLDWVRRLTIDASGAIDLTPIAALSKLEHLDVTLATVADLSPLAKLTELRSLSMFPRTAKSIAPIGKLTKLRTLTLGRLDKIPPAEMKHLGNLTELTSLSLSSAAPRSLRFVGKLTKLRKLEMENLSLVRSLKGLAKHPSLEVVAITRLWNLFSVAPLGSLPKLHTLRLSGALRVRSLAGLERSKSLSRIEIRRTTWTKLPGMYKLASVRRLVVDDNRVLRNIASVYGTPNLESISLRDTAITSRSLGPLRALKKLTQVDVRGTKVMSVMALASIKSLKSIRMGTHQAAANKAFATKRPDVKLDVSAGRS